jgi:putative redox protein
MVPVTVLYEGTLRCKATHDNSGVSFITDAPKDNFGNGASFSPTDLVATALGTCMITTIGIKLRGQQVNIDGTHLAIEKHMSTDLPRRIAKIVVKLSFPSGIAADFRPKIKEFGDTCPVAKTLHPDVLLDVQYNFPD